LQERQIKEECNRQISILEGNEQINSDRIHKAEDERDALKIYSEDGESTRLDPVLQDKLNNQVYQLWKSAKYGAKGFKDEDKSGIENYSTLSLIEETENILNKYFEEFNFLMSHHKIEIP
jgi:hypothetical protein